MLQIIGWLGCFMVSVKLMEMMCNPSFRREDGSLREGPFSSIVTGWIGVVVFTVWLLAQGGAFSDGTSEIEARTAELQRQNDCMERAGEDFAAVAACAR